MELDWTHLVTGVALTALTAVVKFLWSISKSLTKIVNGWDLLVQKLDNALLKLESHDKELSRLTWLETFCKDNRVFIEQIFEDIKILKAPK